MSVILEFTIIFFAYNSITIGAYGLDSGLRVSLEFLQVKYANEKYVEGYAIAVPVSNRTKKVRGSGLIRYQPTKNLEISVVAYKVLKKNKEYLFARGTRKIESLMMFNMIPAVDEALGYFSPRLSWPPLPNVTYKLRDYWFPNSQVPTDLPMPVPTGKFKGIGTVLYPNNTILAVAEAIINIIHSYEKFD